MGVKIQASYDSHSDALYVQLAELEISRSSEEPPLILRYDTENQVVGAVLLGAGKMHLSEWFGLPERDLLPLAIVEVIDDFVSSGIIPSAWDAS